MARPRKDNAEWFPHYASMRNDPKIKVLRARFGFVGYGVWCMILETLASSNHFTMSWDEVSQEITAGDFGVSTAEMREIVDSCVFLRLLSVETNAEGEQLFCPKITELLKPLTDKREFLRQIYLQKQGSKRVSTPETAVSTAETPQSRDRVEIEYRREEEEKNSPAESVRDDAKAPSPSPPPNPPPPSKLNQPLNHSFDEFWQSYDKRCGDKRKLEKKWERLSDGDRAAIIAYIQHYKAAQPEKQFRKNPETFFNQRAWNDEIFIRNDHGTTHSERPQQATNFAKPQSAYARRLALTTDDIHASAARNGWLNGTDAGGAGSEHQHSAVVW